MFNDIRQCRLYKEEFPMRTLPWLLPAVLSLGLTVPAMALTVEREYTPFDDPFVTGESFEELFNSNGLSFTFREYNGFLSVKIRGDEPGIKFNITDYHILRPHHVVWEVTVGSDYDSPSGRFSKEIILESFNYRQVIGYSGYDQIVRRIIIEVVLKDYFFSPNSFGHLSGGYWMRDLLHRILIEEYDTPFSINASIDRISAYMRDGEARNLVNLRRIRIYITPTAINGFPITPETEGVTPFRQY